MPIAAHLVELGSIQGRDIAAGDFDGTGGRTQLPAYQAQQRGLAATAAAHDRDDLAPRHLQVDAAQDLALAIGEADILQAHQQIVGFGNQVDAPSGIFKAR